LKIAIDTNVVLDVLLAREPFVDDSAQVMWSVESSAASAVLCATTITTIHYIARKAIGHTESIAAIEELLKVFDIAPVNRQVLQTAAASKIGDYEDAVLAHAAVHAGATAIITRNPKDFVKSELRVYTPKEWLTAQLSTK
jgi:predicted nucleic acid-binding protein